MSTPVWAPSPWRKGETTSVVSLLEVNLSGQHLQVKDSEIGEVYLDTYVFRPESLTIVVKFDANGIKSVEVAR